MRSKVILLAAMAAATISLYTITIILGLGLKNLSSDKKSARSYPGMNWTPPSTSSIPTDKSGDLVRKGALLFDATPLYAPQFASAKLSCSSCHVEGGIQPYASPMVGLPQFFPAYSERAGHVISLKDRIQECFVRSENGRPLDYNGQEMEAVIAYINWLSRPEPGHRAFIGRGLASLPNLRPNRTNGERVYAFQCAGCHGADGQGSVPIFPPLWGPQSFNDGAGMNGIRKMAAFVLHNMPQNRMGILTPQESWDVSAYINSQPRPVFNSAYEHF